MAVSGRTILWVDDDLDRLSSHVEIFQLRGHRVVKAVSPIEALKLLAEVKRTFALVILDVRMAFGKLDVSNEDLARVEEFFDLKADLRYQKGDVRTSGALFYDLVKTRLPETPIVIFSVLRKEEAPVVLRELLYIQKPRTASELYAAVAKLLEEQN